MEVQIQTQNVFYHSSLVDIHIPLVLGLMILIIFHGALQKLMQMDYMLVDKANGDIVELDVQFHQTYKINI